MSTTVNPPTIQEALAHYDLVKAVVHDIMRVDVHYGASFPGDKKKNLLKPGADALGVAFKFAPEFDVVIDHMEDGHREYNVKCRIKTRDGMLIASGVGSCSTMESKYRYRQADRICPNCGKPFIIKGKAEWGGGWLCYQKKGGCGTKYAEQDPVIANQVVGRIENPDIADVYNTCLKIGKKRAYVDATITATGANDEFTQDAEDFAAPAPTPAAKAAPASTPPPQAQAQAPAPQPKAQPAPAGPLGIAGMAAAMQKATSKAQLEDVWNNQVIANQSTLTAQQMVAMMKVKREVEKYLAGGGQ